MEELIAKDKRSSSKLSEIDSEVSIVAANIRSFLPKLDYLEGQSRRNNIVIDGIQESGNESWAQSEEKKAPIPRLQPGEGATHTVLNVFGPMGNRRRYLLDNLRTGALNNEEYYKDCDLTLGAVINVWGRNVLLCDWDDFTKEFYRSKYGIASCSAVDRRALQRVINVAQKTIGCSLPSLEDIFSSRYIPVDTERMFIISYHLCDDTLSVYERTQRNLGVFLERGRVKTPGQELFKSDLSECYGAQDLYVGARLCLNAHEFQLTDADEFTLSYMEQNAEELSEHELLALGRRYSAAERREEEEARRRSDPGLKLQAAAVAQERLKKSQYESFSDMARAFLEEDRA
ncbi:hypothetical protein AAFF_G00342340, partial [Aldrovandia affinis]